VLPQLVHVGGPAGSGRGARYVWPDPEVVTQTAALIGALGLRGRHETAVVLTWLAGFEYPVSMMRTMWAEFEEMPWRNTVRQALEGSPFDVGAAVEVLVGDAAATRLGRILSRDLVRTRTRLVMDPSFRPARDLTPKQAERIRDDLPRLAPRAAEFVPFIRGEHVKAFVVFMQDYLSRPKLAALIRSLSDEELAAVHRDIHFLTGPYRLWLADAIRRENEGGEANLMAFWLAPRLAWLAGRFLMLMDIALRRLGFRDEVEATLDHLQRLGEEAETRRILVHLMRDYREVMTITGGDRDRLGEEFRRCATGDTDYEAMRKISDSVVATLVDIWRPAIKTILAVVGDAGAGLDARAAQ